MSGKRALPRPDRPRAPRVSNRVAVAALAVVGLAVAWGYLTLRAIDFGSGARAGGSGGWWYLSVTAVAAIGCLFFALVLGVRLARHVLGAGGVTLGVGRPAGRRIGARPRSRLRIGA